MNTKLSLTLLLIFGVIVLVLTQILGLWVPIIITILGIIYIISPVDFLSEAVLGPLGYSDDAIVGIIIVASWLIYFFFPVIKIILYVVVGVFLIFGLIMLLKYLHKKSLRRR